MIANWKNAKTEFPEQRIRVMVVGDSGMMRTAFYGVQSDICGDSKVCWRTDEIYDIAADGSAIVGRERALDARDVVYWDNFPVSPFPKRDIWTHQPVFEKPEVCRERLFYPCKHGVTNYCGLCEHNL